MCVPPESLHAWSVLGHHHHVSASTEAGHVALSSSNAVWWRPTVTCRLVLHTTHARQQHALSTRSVEHLVLQVKPPYTKLQGLQPHTPPGTTRPIIRFVCVPDNSIVDGDGYDENPHDDVYDGLIGPGKLFLHVLPSGNPVFYVLVLMDGSLMCTTLLLLL